MSKRIARIVNLVDTDLGRMAVEQSVVEEADIDDYMELKVISQGTLMQFDAASKLVDPTKTDGKIATAFYGKAE